MGEQINKCKKNMIYDAGVLYIDYGLVTERILGMTRGGAEYTVTSGQKPIEADGLKGMTKGMKRITKIDASLSVQLLEQSPDNIQLVMGCASQSNPGVYTTKIGEFLGLGTAGAETFACDEVPVAGSLVFYVDGVKQNFVAGTHYTLLDDDITIIGNDTIALDAPVVVNYVYDAGGDDTHVRITPKFAIEDADYLSNVALVVPVSDDINSKHAVYFIKNALSNGELKAKTNDEDELVVPILFNGHWEDIRSESEDPLTYVDYPVIAP